MKHDQRTARLQALERIGITEATVRRTAEKFRKRYPWRGDYFTLEQVECLLFELDAARELLDAALDTTP